ncbi:MAG: hypothetical protein JW809_11735 [Pirellulales bacterium]|nr:hypothetical protein [Pirellulales bacterium]
MAAIDTAKNLLKKTQKQFSSLTFEQGEGGMLLRMAGDDLTLAEIAGGAWQLASRIPIPTRLKKTSEAKLRKWYESLDPKLPYADRAFEIAHAPPKGVIQSVSVSITWKSLDGITPPELIAAVNSLRTGAMYVRRQFQTIE